MTNPLLLPLQACTDPTLVGGKAVGLARLLAAGFPVPPGICITTAAYRQALLRAGLQEDQEWRLACTLPTVERNRSLAHWQSLIRNLDISDLEAAWTTALTALDLPPTTRWAVRSSATNEDSGRQSFAGLYHTRLSIARDSLTTTVKDLWASVWHEQVVLYMRERGSLSSIPLMAVILQPMLNPLAAGVAYSIHPVTGQSFQVVINAVPGLAAPLVDGQVSPDHFVVDMWSEQSPPWIRRRSIAHKSSRLIATDTGLCEESIPESNRQQPSLSDEDLLAVAYAVKRVERAFRCPVDVEWAIDSEALWILQARPITGIHPSADVTNDDCEWSRTNLKETMPEVPSPFGLSLMERFMEDHIIAPYRKLGCTIPAGMTSTRVLYGRPYLNVTLFHMLQAQVRSDPSLLTEHMGGEPISVAPPVEPMPWPSFLRAAFLMMREIRRAVVHGPTRFIAMKEVANRYSPSFIASLSLREAIAQLEELRTWFQQQELTFGIAGGVAHCLQTLGRLLPRWLGADWRALCNAALQGQGTVISAQQILRLAQLAHIARHEPVTASFFTTHPWNPAEFRQVLRDTTFLQAFDTYLEDYGHRAVGESDVMVPRFADQPEAILAVLRTYLHTSAQAPDDILARQARARAEALRAIKRRLGWRLHRWWIYQWWDRRLRQFLSLREANRHHLMYVSLATRRLLLHIGDLLVSEGIFDTRDDVFFLTLQEVSQLGEKSTRDWRSVIRTRRAERARNEALHPPDTIRDWATACASSSESTCHTDVDLLSGLPISAGTAKGPVRVLRSPHDWGFVQAGDILVTAVIDPGMAPLFGIAAGIIAEMGGVLSHGAIIAREYGIPAIANVKNAVTLLRNGTLVHLNASLGTVRLLPPTPDLLSPS
ncbi:MAG: PEP-utilizing enzyme [Nitrospira sp.]|nr:PEP-utilizing enzyme [Nitrospira sp.]